jgi:hypothetical protein
LPRRWTPAHTRLFTGYLSTFLTLPMPKESRVVIRPTRPSCRS